MSAFFALLQREDGVVAFGTALMTKLQTKGVSQDTMTKWWTRSAGCTLDQATIIVMPVPVRDNHWIVVAANTATKMITFYCSPGRNDYGKYTGHMAVFLSAQRPNTEHNLEWSSSSQSLAQARQRDGNECGVFACVTAMALAKGRSPDSYTEDQVYKGSMGRRIIQLSRRRETLHDWCDEEAPEVTRVKAPNLTGKNSHTGRVLSRTGGRATLRIRIGRSNGLCVGPSGSQEINGRHGETTLRGQSIERLTNE